jgi:8-oxo-dGTP diphosphatase
MEGRFNIRVYGIWIDSDRLLVNEEFIQGRRIIKLPGGGLEYGEGTLDCLIREWKEELCLDIRVLNHFYTTDFFQPSAFGKKSQVISIYYRVEALEAPSALCNTVAGERSYWLPLHEVHEATFTLPIDRIIGGMLARGMR